MLSGTGDRFVETAVEASTQPLRPAPGRTRRLIETPAVREWRLVVRELLAQSATDPMNLDANVLRPRLDRKLEQIEGLIAERGAFALGALFEGLEAVFEAVSGVAERLLRFDAEFAHQGHGLADRFDCATQYEIVRYFYGGR